MVKSANNNALNIKLDLRLVVLFLLATIGIMLLMWRPWQSQYGVERSISETGQTNIKAVPDEFVFYPTFKSSDSNQETAKSEVTKTTDEVVEKLKNIGVQEENLELNVYGYDGYPEPLYFNEDQPEGFSASASLQIVVDNRELAQEVQDYLDTTEATGQLTPQARFSETKQAELEIQARQEAINDAKSKAEQSAELLGVKVGDVITVNEGSGFDSYPLAGVAYETNLDGRSSSLPVLPGKNDFVYSVKVTFGIK